jgi:hypothetical protein
LTSSRFIGKGKPHKPYEFGVKVSVATTLKRCKGGQFVTTRNEAAAKISGHLKDDSSRTTN